MGVNVSCPINMKCPSKLSIGCRRRNKKSHQISSGKVVIIYDEESKDGLIVLGAGTVEGGRLTLNSKEPIVNWSTMTVDNTGRVVALCGGMLMAASIGKVGDHLNQCFKGSFKTVIRSMYKIAMKQKCTVQLNCVHGRKSVTMIMYVLHGMENGIIGAHMVCRPTQYDVQDIEHFLEPTRPVVTSTLI